MYKLDGFTIPYFAMISSTTIREKYTRALIIFLNNDIVTKVWRRSYSQNRTKPDTKTIFHNLHEFPFADSGLSFGVFPRKPFINLKVFRTESEIGARPSEKVCSALNFGDFRQFCVFFLNLLLLV